MKANETEDAPYSVEEMRELISRLGPITGLEYARAISTAAALEEAVATMTASWADLVAAVRLVDGSQVVAYAPVGLEVRAFGADDLDARGLPRWKP